MAKRKRKWATKVVPEIDYERNIEIEDSEDAENDNDKNMSLGRIVLKLEKPFMYDGIMVEEINLTDITNLTARQLLDVDKDFTRLGYETNGLVMEATRGFAILVTAKINHKPSDWLMQMGARDSVRLRSFISKFFLSMSAD